VASVIGRECPVFGPEGKVTATCADCYDFQAMDHPSPTAVGAPAGSIRALLATHGVTPTAQRMRVAEVLFACDQHLTADQVIAALREGGSRVSKATVYNTLNLFAEKGLLKALNVDPMRCSFDSNMRPHFHFHVSDTGELIDINPADVEFARLPALPPGMESMGMEVLIRVRRKA
jgi:Fur family iron response transcriptional regulator